MIGFRLSPPSVYSFDGMLKQKRENRLIHCMVCWKCGGRTGPNHYVLENGGVTCGLCGDKNPLGNLKRMPLEEIRASYEIVLCFVPRRHQLPRTPPGLQDGARSLAARERRRDDGEDAQVPGWD
jgi:hypothetical protein